MFDFEELDREEGRVWKPLVVREELRGPDGDDFARHALDEPLLLCATPAAARVVALFGPGVLALPLLTAATAGGGEATAAGASEQPASTPASGARPSPGLSREALEGRFGRASPGYLLERLSDEGPSLEARLQAMSPEELQEEVHALTDWKSRAAGRLKVLEQRAAWALIGLRMPRRRASNGSCETAAGDEQETEVDAAAVRRAFKRKALELHPDKGGDSERFQMLQDMKELLFDDHGGLPSQEEERQQPSAAERMGMAGGSSALYEPHEVYQDERARAENLRDLHQALGPGNEFNRVVYEGARRRLQRNFEEMWDRAGKLAEELKRSQPSGGDGDALRELRIFLERFARSKISSQAGCVEASVEQIFESLLLEGAELLCVAGVQDPVSTLSSVALLVHLPLEAAAPGSNTLKSRFAALSDAILALPSVLTKCCGLPDRARRPSTPGQRLALASDKLDRPLQCSAAACGDEVDVPDLLASAPEPHCSSDDVVNGHVRRSPPNSLLGEPMGVAQSQRSTPHAHLQSQEAEAPHAQQAGRAETSPEPQDSVLPSPPDQSCDGCQQTDLGGAEASVGDHPHQDSGLLEVQDQACEATPQMGAVAPHIDAIVEDVHSLQLQAPLELLSRWPSHLSADLMLLLWNDLCCSANLAYAAHAEDLEKPALLQKSVEDANRSQKHLAALEGAGSLGSPTLTSVRQLARDVGQRVAATAAAVAEVHGSTTNRAPPTNGATDGAIDGTIGGAASGAARHPPPPSPSPPTPCGISDELWLGTQRAAALAGEAVEAALRQQPQRSRVLQEAFEGTWKQLGRSADGEQVALGGSDVGLPGTTRLLAWKLPTAFGMELKWFVWNEIWRFGNSTFASRGDGLQRLGRLHKSYEDARRAESHFNTAVGMAVLPRETMALLRKQAGQAGRAAGVAALFGAALQRGELRTLPPPGGAAEPELWSLMVDAVFMAASAVSRMLTEAGFIPGRFLQFDFEKAWHDLLDDPPREAPRADNAASLAAASTAVAAVSGAGGMQQLQQSVSLGEEERARFREDGFLGPAAVLSEAELEPCREAAQRLVAQARGRQLVVLPGSSVGAGAGTGAGIAGEELVACHVRFPCLHALASHPAVVGKAAAVLDTDELFLYTSSIVVIDGDSEPSEGQELEPWQQDGRDLSAALGPMEEMVSAVVALTPCDEDCGALEYARRFALGGLGNTSRVDLRPGEMALHSAYAVYRQKRRRSSALQRVVVVLRYISGRMRDRRVEVGDQEPRDLAVLVQDRGAEEGRFRLLPPPVREDGEEEMARWEELRRFRVRRYGKML